MYLMRDLTKDVEYALLHIHFDNMPLRRSHIDLLALSLTDACNAAIRNPLIDYGISESRLGYGPYLHITVHSEWGLAWFPPHLL